MPRGNADGLSPLGRGCALCVFYGELHARSDAMNGEAVVIAQRLGLGQVAIADALDLVVDDLPGFRQA